MTIFDQLVEWNKSRNLHTFDLANELRLLDEELDELRTASTDLERIDALCDLIVVATGAIHKLRYDPNVAMEETYYEINSRKGSVNSTGKWQKDPNQDPSTLYKANYTLAKYKD